MATMTEAEILAAVKTSNLISGAELDGMLTAKIKEVKQYMLSAGVPAEVVESDIAAGVIAIGVTDLYSPQGTGGSAHFSNYFLARVNQMR